MPPNDDDDIWAIYAKGVKPLKVAAAAKKSRPRKMRIAPAAKEEIRPVSATPKIKQTSSADFRAPLDHALERSLRRGTLTIEARLDLHGMYRKEAHEALDMFIARQAKAGRRNLLIITGKGRGGEGVLRANLAGWLAASPFAARILALRPAAARHGGAGAFYVMLRRKD